MLLRYNTVTYVMEYDSRWVLGFSIQHDCILQFTSTHAHTLVSSHFFTVLLCSGKRSPSFGFPNCPQLRHPTTELQQLSSFLTKSLHEPCIKHCSSVAAEMCIFFLAEPLLSNSCCTVAYFVAAA
jgi:hypothetical protein